VIVTISETDEKVREALIVGREKYIDDGSFRMENEDDLRVNNIVVLNMPTPHESEDIDAILQKVEHFTKKGSYLIIQTDAPEKYHKPFERDPRWEVIVRIKGRVFPTFYGTSGFFGPQGSRSTVTMIVKRLSDTNE